MQIASYLDNKPKNKHFFTLGFAGTCRRTKKPYVGRVQLMANDYTHAVKRAHDFYAKDFDQLEVYGCHLANEVVV